MINEKVTQKLVQVHRKETLSQSVITACGIAAALLPFLMAAFLLVKGSGTFGILGTALRNSCFLPSGNPVTPWKAAAR